MIEGSCHCGSVRWRFDGTPDSATLCNCTICRRYSVLWAYGHEDEDIHISGNTSAYIWGDRCIGFHFCPACGCVAYWRALAQNDQGRRRIAVNLRLAEPDHVASIALDRCDGLISGDDLPRDGRSVADVLF